MTTCIVLPGIFGSGPQHWQTVWEQSPGLWGSATGLSFCRFAPGDWDDPVLADWIAALESAVREAESPPVLVAHSLSCLLVPFWAASSTSVVAGAFLVAPVDPASAAFPVGAHEFRAVPRGRLPFPSLVVGSRDDPYATAAYSRGFAANLGARFEVAGALGHINADSDLGDWPQGRALFADFVAGLGGGSGARD